MVSEFSGEQVQSSFPEYAVTLPALGHGTFKSAYRAEESGRELVIKILKDPVDPDFDDAESADLPARFARELKGMAAVESPHLVTLLQEPAVRDIGVNKHLWYAEPYYSGGTLTEKLKAGETGAALASSVTCGLLEAVSAMWDANQIVHRDIKPDNVAFDASGNVVLLDLGIAYFPNLTTLTDGMDSSPRTPRYAAPEQFIARRAATIDFRTDLFQIGIVAHETLTGEHPFWSTSVDAREYFQRMDNYDVSQLDGIDCPDALKRLITRLLASRPSGRYRNVEIPLRAARGLM